MLNTLIETRAPRTRRTRSAILSATLHAALIAGAIVVAGSRAKVDATTPRDPPLIYTSIPKAEPQAPAQGVASTNTSAQPVLQRIDIEVPTVPVIGLPAIDLKGPAMPTDHIVIGGPGLPTSPIGDRAGGLPNGGVATVAMVDRIPSLVGNQSAPLYPSALRASGVTGNVVARFVVDTLGRAEMGTLEIVESGHALFTESVRQSLAGYRFSPGEMAGRKVRTMVQLPFTFSLH